MWKKRKTEHGLESVSAAYALCMVWLEGAGKTVSLNWKYFIRDMMSECCSSYYHLTAFVKSVCSLSFCPNLEWPVCLCDLRGNLKSCVFIGFGWCKFGHFAFVPLKNKCSGLQSTFVWNAHNEASPFWCQCYHFVWWWRKSLCMKICSSCNWLFRHSREGFFSFSFYL